ICIPSFVAGSGPHQFARLAKGFASPPSVTVLGLPGARLEEPAPATWHAAIGALAEAARAVAGDDPYVLVGYSSGGAVAHAVAERLEAEGTAASGIVMIDTYAPQDGAVFAWMLGEVMDRSHEYLQIEDGDLLTMGTFMRLGAEWEPGEVGAPALFVRAAMPLGSGVPVEEFRAPLEHPASIVTVQADHFSMIEVEAPRTAAAIAGWLDELVARPQDPGSTARESNGTNPARSLNRLIT
ncbi:MAG: alpha/beta fold hydrolase, partial [Solirubrobacteraceae bacterium]